MRDRLTNGHPDDFLVINVGRHSPEKGLEQMRDPIARLPGVRLALIGGGPSHERLRDYYRGTSTVFPGYFHGDELIAAYRAADAFVFPSTTETFGLVALEAMACRIPVIAARAGGVTDVITDGVNGFFFDPDQPQQLGPLVERLRDNPALCEEMAENGLQHAQSRSWEATMDQLIDYYYLAIRLWRTQLRRRKSLGYYGS
jgi:glycosyltransferase involved in cell wall biosynthesis